MSSPYPRKTLKPFGYGADESTRDLHEKGTYSVDAMVLHDYSPTLVRTASNASTSAGSSSSLEHDSPTHLPSMQIPSIPSWKASSQFEELAQRPQAKAISDVQVRKVFVGGIPQTVDQNELLKLFSQVAKVKKAWIQRYSQTSGVSNARNHRGFGFVIFSDKYAVNRMMGEAASRFIVFGEGLQFEVKRAVGKLVGAAVSPEQRSYQGFLNTSKRLTASPQALIASESASSQTAPLCSDACATFPQVARFPPVPPFPLEGVPNWKTSQAFPGPPVRLWAAVPPSAHAVAQCVTRTAVPKTLIELLVGQEPQDQQDLERMLLSAMPDHYED